MISTMRELIDDWNKELAALKSELVELGSKADLMEYNLLSCEALRLSMCISDALELELQVKG